MAQKAVGSSPIIRPMTLYNKRLPIGSLFCYAIPSNILHKKVENKDLHIVVGGEPSVAPVHHASILHTMLTDLRVLASVPSFVATIAVLVIIMLGGGGYIIFSGQQQDQSKISSVKKTQDTNSKSVATQTNDKNKPAKTSSTPAASTQTSTTQQKGGNQTSSTNTVSSGSTTGGTSSTSTTSNTTPAGEVYALLDPGDTSATAQTYLNMSNVDGVAFRTTWAGLEPTAGNYNWTSLDSIVQAAAASNKKVVIHIGSSAGGWPNWLTTLGAQTYTYTTPAGSRTDPIPWDSVYTQRYGQMVSAVGNHISTTGKLATIAAVSADVPVSEMTIVGCINGLLTGGTAYNRTAYMNTWKSAIAANAAAFPGKKIEVSLPLAFICLNDGNDGKSFATELFNAVRNTTPVTFFAADLNAVGSARTAQADSIIKSAVGVQYQTIWSSTNDSQNKMQGSLSSAICYGWNAGGRSFEIYKVDLTNTGLQSAINQARTGAGC